ncbi:MAG: type II secretion system protein [Candidatus Paceibacterota bacterium]|jgi:prepilin-type N-terminal cleavage/methylation domain-containing protein
MKNNQKGFTLIEMLVVVAIVGLLSSIVVVGLGGARSKARDAKRLSEVQQILNWAELNYAQTGYPTTASTTASTALTLKDPQGNSYAYGPGATAQTYYAATCLENPDSAKVDTGCLAKGSMAPTALTCADALLYCRAVTGQ